MSGYEAWVKKQRGSPVMLLITFVGLTGGCYLAYTKLWAPFSRRRKLTQSGIYGNYIYEQEKKRKHQE